jgi:hypothetical protein
VPRPLRVQEANLSERIGKHRSTGPRPTGRRSRRLGLLRRVTLLASFLACQSVVAGPVALSSDLQGGALIVPFWTVEAGNDTMVSLRNNSTLPVALKVRVIDGDGFELTAFNLYLNDDDSWTGAITAVGAGAELISADASCVLPRFGADDAGVVRVGLPVSGRRSGYIEIVEMGVQNVGLVGGPPSPWAACASLAERFETGDWASDPGTDLDSPAGLVSASVQLIDVADGGMVSVPITVLDGFSDIVQHSAPDDAAPNLSTPHAPGADAEATQSRWCGSNGCSVLSWERPVEAIASLLAAPKLRGDVTVNPAIGALTELVVTRPLKRYEDADGFDLAADPAFALYDREGRFVESVVEAVQLSPPPPPKATPIEIPALTTDDAVVSISFAPPGAEGPPVASPLLGLPGDTLSMDGTGFVSGHAELALNETGETRLVSIEGQWVRGDAAIGVRVLQYRNGTLVPDPSSEARVLSNYRMAEPMTSR